VIGSSIATADNNAVFIIGKGTVIIDILLEGQSTKIRLNDVYHCPGLHYNLMSVGQVIAKGYTCRIQESKFLFIDSMRVIALTGSRSDGGFYFVDAPANFSNSQTLASRTHVSVKTS